MTRGAFSGASAQAGGDPSAIGSRSELAAALTRLRELTGLSVRDLARRVDSPVATIGGYFSGRHLPTVAQSAVFFRLMAACGVDDPDAQQQWWDAVSRVRRAGAARPASMQSPYRAWRASRFRTPPCSSAGNASPRTWWWPSGPWTGPPGAWSPSSVRPAPESPRSCARA